MPPTNFWANAITFLVGTAVLGSAAMPGARAQAGFPDSLRRYSDNQTVPFRIGTAVTLQGGPSLYPPNGYQPGLLTQSAQDKAYQSLVRGQFNQIEAGNETKMMSLWTGGTVRVQGHFAAKTNLSDPQGPLAQLCQWAEAQRRPLTVRGHCMVYSKDYTLPPFPAGQPPLFVHSADGRIIRNTVYTPDDLREMLQSYVRQVVDATMAQNAKSRRLHGYEVIRVWDVTNEVVSEDAKDAELPGVGFAYRNDDPWYNNGPHGPAGTGGYDYVGDLYRWASLEMKKDIGRIIAGQKITRADRFALYYNDYNLEWNALKMTHTLNMIRHIRQQGGAVDGLGFQAHVEANGLNTKQFGANIAAAIAAGLRFSVTEADCAIHADSAKLSIAQQEANQGREYGQIAQLCLDHKKFCDAIQIWGATDDGSWLPNAEATPVTRWISDTRPGATQGKMGYWPKEGQFAAETRYDPVKKLLDPQSGHAVSNAYDQMLAALKSSQKPFPQSPLRR